MDFQILRHANSLRQAEWDTHSKVTLEYRGNELAGEVGEACNIIKKFARERNEMRGSRATVDDLAKELADVISCVDLIALSMDIDLGVAVRDKFNETSDKYSLTTSID